MSFYRISTVKNPRKQHTCNMCNNPITGKHIYIATVQEGIFYSLRIHEECKIRMDTMCSHCEFSSDCQDSVEECYIDTFGEGQHK